jgi:hypothetical protein
MRSGWDKFGQQDEKQQLQITDGWEETTCVEQLLEEKSPLKWPQDETRQTVMTAGWDGTMEVPQGWERTNWDASRMRQGSYHNNWMIRDKLRWRLNEKDNWEDSWLRRDKPKWQEDVAGKTGITDVCIWEQQDEKGQTEMTAGRTDARWYGTTDMPAGCTVTKPMTVSRYTWMRFFLLKWFGQTTPSGILLTY